MCVVVDGQSRYYTADAKLTPDDVASLEEGGFRRPPHPVARTMSIYLSLAKREMGYDAARGDHVLVVQGPFAGVAGVFVRYGARGRVVVNIEALGQYAGVEVSEDDIEIIPKILT